MFRLLTIKQTRKRPAPHFQSARKFYGGYRRQQLKAHNYSLTGKNYISFHVHDYSPQAEMQKLLIKETWQRKNELARMLRM
jgi:hypothetical protein